tara:strand:+ start:2799 stop:3278 length:480 start_codon:yes stop_codon:yes gene_type:complete
MANEQIPGILRGLLKFSSDDLKKYADKIRNTHVEQTKKGIDAFGKPFKRYSRSYRVKKANRGFAKQVSTKVSPPDLTLTGKMFNNFKVMATRTEPEIQIKYGIKSNKDGHKLAKNNKTRVIAGSNRVGPLVQKEVVKMFEKNTKKNLKNISRQRINITL